MKGKTLKILLSYFENEEILCRACKIQNNLYTLIFSAEFRHSQEKRTGNFKKKMCRFYPIFIRVHYRGRLGFLDDISNNFYVLYLFVYKYNTSYFSCSQFMGMYYSYTSYINR